MGPLKLLVLACAKYSGLFYFAKLATRGQLRVLAYHGFELVDESRFRPKMFQTGATFRSRLSMLRKHRADVLSLSDAVHQLGSAGLSSLPVVITIDDGWASINEVAVPALREAGLPATVYVTTYYVQRQVPVFGMLIQYLLWQTTCKSLRTDGLAGLNGTPVDLGDHRARDALVQDLLSAGAALPTEGERQDLARELAQRLGLDFDRIAGTRCLSLMSADELASLARSGIDIQLHTHRHRFPLERLEDAEREVIENRDILQGIIGSTPEHFCYPSGVWGPQAFRMLDGLGIKSSTTCEPGFVTPVTPRQAWSRFLDGENIRSLEFEAEICGFLELLRRVRRGLTGRQPA